MKGIEDKCMAAGMNDYISKPVDQSQMKEKLEKWLPDIDIEKTGSNNVIDLEQLSSNDINIINYKKLSLYSDGDKSLEKEILSVFKDNLIVDIKQLNEKFGNSDQEAWLEYAHKIFGSAANIGAEQLAEICDKSHEKKKMHKEGWSILHKQIMEQSESVIAYLEKKCA